MKIKNIYLSFFSAIFLIISMACSTTPSGWTRAAWSSFVKNNPEQANAMKYINSSSKRRKQLQIFLSEMSPETRMSDGNYAGITFLHNSMTGENSYIISFPLQELLLVMSRQVDSEDSPKFSDLLIQQLGVRKIERQIQITKALQSAYANDPDAPKDPNAAASIHSDELRLAHLQEIAARIKAIGD